eukprot:PhF_6_TR26344/c0_g1_i2/m.37904
MCVAILLIGLLVSSCIWTGDGSALADKEKGQTLQVDLMQTWSVRDVGRWLRQQYLSEYEELFHKQGIDGPALLELTVEDFREIGIDKEEAERIMLVRDNRGSATKESGDNTTANLVVVKESNVCTPVDEERVAYALEAMSYCLRRHHADRNNPSAISKLCQCYFQFVGDTPKRCVESIGGLKATLTKYNESIGATCKKSASSRIKCSARELDAFAASANKLQGCVHRDQGDGKIACPCFQELADHNVECRAHHTMRRLWSQLATALTPLCPAVKLNPSTIKDDGMMDSVFEIDLNTIGTKGVQCDDLAKHLVGHKCLKPFMSNAKLTQFQIHGMCTKSCAVLLSTFWDYYPNCTEGNNTNTARLKLRDIGITMRSLCHKVRDRYVYEDFMVFQSLFRGHEDAMMEYVTEKLKIMVMDESGRRVVFRTNVRKVTLDRLKALENRIGYTAKERHIACGDGTRSIVRLHVQNGSLDKKMFLSYTVLCASGASVAVEYVTDNGLIMSTHELDMLLSKNVESEL